MDQAGRGSTPDDALAGWGRIGYARILVAGAMALFAVTDRPGAAPHADWVEEVALTLAILVCMLGIIQVSGRQGSSGFAKGAALVGFAAAIGFFSLFSYDPSQYAFSLLLLALIEVTVLFGRRGALVGWMLAVGFYLGSTVTLAGPDTAVDASGLALRAVLALALAIGADSIVQALRNEQQRVRTSEDLFGTVFERAPIAIALGDVDGPILTRANETYARLLGYTVPELLGRPVGEFAVGEEWGDQQELQRQVLAGDRDGYEIEKHYLRKDGTKVPAIASVSLVRDDAGAPLYWIAMVTDITERKLMEQAVDDTNAGLRASVAAMERRNRESALLAELAELLAASGDFDEAKIVLDRLLPRLFPGDAGAVYVLRESRNVAEAMTLWNRMPLDEASFEPKTCWAIRRGRVHAVEDLIDHVPCGHVTPIDGTSYVCVPMTAQGETIGVLHLRTRRTPDGSAPEREDLHLPQSVAEQVGLALANFRLREKLLAQSLQDPLTGLYNRRFMTEFLERELHRSIRNERPLSLLMVDVDRLKHYNDTRGHQMGDRLIRETGRVLLDGIRASDLACRYGGDEFLLVLPETTLPEAVALGERLCEAFNTLDLGSDAGAEGPGLSIGVATAPEHGTDPAALIRAADEALYVAKSEGRGRVVHAPTGEPRLAATT